jgi:hypothetical protein
MEAPAVRKQRAGPLRSDPVRGRHAPRALVAAIIGAEAGAAIGLLAIGAGPLVPLGLAGLGAGIGAGSVQLRQKLFRRWLRIQLRS